LEKEHEEATIREVYWYMRSMGSEKMAASLLQHQNPNVAQQEEKEGEVVEPKQIKDNLQQFHNTFVLINIPRIQRRIRREQQAIEKPNNNNSTDNNTNEVENDNRSGDSLCNLELLQQHYSKYVNQNSSTESSDDGNVMDSTVSNDNSSQSTDVSLTYDDDNNNCDV